ELARRWRPLLDYADDCGVDCAFEVHPGEDLHDGASYEAFLDHVDGHARACLLYDPSHFVLQQLDYLQYIDLYHDRIRCFHVRTPSSGPTAASASTAATRTGRTAPAASVRSATARSTSRRSSRC